VAEVGQKSDVMSIGRLSGFGRRCGTSGGDREMPFFPAFIRGPGKIRRGWRSGSKKLAGRRQDVHDIEVAAYEPPRACRPPASTPSRFGLLKKPLVGQFRQEAGNR
jgi:hypothetical protein